MKILQPAVSYLNKSSMTGRINFFIETYGCQMNVSDSELVSSLLINDGFTLAETINDADVIIFNTCSVREHAEIRVLGRISNEVSRKQLNPDLKIGVIGCMAQRIGERLLEINKKIDFIVGVDNYRHLPRIINESLQKSPSLTISGFNSTELYDDIEPVRKGDFSAFISIMRGCDNFCSYCIVPYVRGRERSRPVQSILTEVDRAGVEGYPDVTLLGQNVNSYNYQGIDFADLLMKVNAINSIKRIRFITSHPKDISDKLIEVMAANSKVCEHLHLPLQSGDNDVLALMNRGYTIEHYRNIVDKLRKAVPGIALTTDIIVGFPGETKEQYLNTLRVMEDIGFDFAFMFKYSVRSGTAAANYIDDVEEAEKLSRLDTVINLQNRITHDKYRQQIGKTVEVLVEKVSKKSALELSGKTRDFKITVFPGREELIGSFVNVKVTDAAGWTLKGEIV